MQYARDGCRRIVVADLALENLRDTEKVIIEISSDVQVKSIAVDVRNQASVQTMVDTTLSTFGRLDYCVNCAGVIKFGNTVDLSEEDFEFVYQVNLRGVFLCTKAEVEAMLKQEPLTTK